MIAPRIYDAVLAEHLTKHRQMAFVSGPRQVGKTTTCGLRADAILNWDDFDDRETILAGPKRVAAAVGLDRLRGGTPLVLFDELHKFPRWKQFLKGFFDAHAGRVRIAVTGSSRLGIYRRGGDSLMGRYFSYRMHPFSVAEIAAHDLPDPTRIVRPPRAVANADWDALWRHGGYPEPWLKRDRRFDRRWQALRFDQLVREDIRDLAEVRQLDQLALLARLLGERSAQQIVFSNLASLVRVSVDTARRWVAALCDFHLGFLVRPWFRNVGRSLRKEPKWFLRDWASITDAGPRAETFVAGQLLKAVEGWTDLGLGAFELGYLRDKEKREVDFVVVRDGEPWFLVEVKRGDAPLSPALRRFQDQLGAPFAFQLTLGGDYVPADAFDRAGPPLIAPARTVLSQLL